MKGIERKTAKKQKKVVQEKSWYIGLKCFFEVMEGKRVEVYWGEKGKTERERQVEHWW